MRFWGFQLFARSRFEGAAGFVDSANTVFPDSAIWVRIAISVNFVFPGISFFRNLCFFGFPGICCFWDFLFLWISGFLEWATVSTAGLLMFGLLGFRKRWKVGVCGL